MAGWREYSDDFRDHWWCRGFDVLLADSAFHSSALGPHWHELLPRTQRVVWDVESIIASLSMPELPRAPFTGTPYDPDSEED